jgi:replicative DNA helicase
MTTATEMQDLRVPPHSIDAEVSTLGAMILSPVAIPNVQAVVHAEDFYRPAHQILYRTIVELLQAGVPVDSIAVKNALVTAGKWELIGGMDYLRGILEGVPDSGNAAYYAGIVREKAIQREIIAFAHDLSSQAWSPAADATELITAGQQAFYRLDSRLAEMRPYEMSLHDAAMNVLAHAEKVMADPSHGIGLPTGIPSIDRFTGGGPQRGEMWILAGATGAGKSVLSSCFAAHWAANGMAGLIVSGEMPAPQVAKRFLQAVANVPGGRLRNPQSLTMDDWTALQGAAGHPFRHQHEQHRQQAVELNQALRQRMELAPWLVLVLDGVSHERNAGARALGPWRHCSGGSPEGCSRTVQKARAKQIPTAAIRATITTRSERGFIPVRCARRCGDWGAVQG